MAQNVPCALPRCRWKRLAAAGVMGCGLLAAGTAAAQQDANETGKLEIYGPLAQVSAPPAGVPGALPPPPWHQDLRLRNTVIIGAGALIVAAYGMSNWWQEGFSGGFKTTNEGFFGENTPHGGMDKFGHMFANYANVRAFTQVFQAAGNSRGDAIWLSALSTAAVFTAVEVADGFSNQYRFSPQDEAMNIAGAALGVILETHPELDEKFDFRLGYSKSAESAHWKPFSDYSGQRYLLVAKADGFDALRNRPVLRYLELSLGYQARGYEHPGLEHRRDVYVGLSLNLSRVLADGFYQGKKSTTRVQRTAELAFELFQFPTAVYADFRID
ncbi:hypothetical protein UC35_15325 [Ramlibacter tataouinensis]|uniref:DUF2279 domain-containing protein n=1 Tax=Ramlibacter tataouinensis TaxID=94132 RepID=A0A127JVN3_9BURK|nr:hypothetical protein UC35_15325 [Ramlibacter tataouinensis]